MKHRQMSTYIYKQETKSVFCHLLEFIHSFRIYGVQSMVLGSEGRYVPCSQSMCAYVLRNTCPKQA